MVKVLLRQKHPTDPKLLIEKQLAYDGYLKANLDIGIEQLHKDFDQVWTGS